MECRLLHFCTDDYILILSGFSSCTFLYGWLLSHFEWIFVIYISVRMTTFSFWIDFRHVHFCTNDYHFFLSGLSSYKFLHARLSIYFEKVFFMYMFVRMTIYFFLIGFRHAHVCTNDYQFPCVLVFVMHISVRMTIHFFWMGFSHAHFCTNDYPFLFNRFSSCICLYEWLSIPFEWVFVMHISVRMTKISFWMDCLHLHFCTNDYHFFSIYCRRLHFCTNDYHFFLYGFLSCTFLYEWLPFLFEWIVVIYISVRLTTISFWMECRHFYFCKNDYHFFLNVISSCTFLYEWLPLRCIWFFVIHILCKWLSIFFLYGFSSCTFLCEWLSILFWFFHVRNALQCVNNMVQWRIINDIIMYIGFDHVLNTL